MARKLASVMIFSSKDPLQIVVFQSYGTATRLYVRGRALEDERENLEATHPLKLLVNAYKRFESDEIVHTALLLKLPDGRVLESITDDKGYFLFDVALPGLELLCNKEGWLKFEISYKKDNIKRQIQLDNKFTGEMLIPAPNCSFGVVSDIDDTILHTGLVSRFKWRVIYNTFLKPVSARIPLEGAAPFYHLLHRGPSGQQANPIFYVSHSPWNMYGYLNFFLTKNNFPKGPILLRAFREFRKRKHQQEKPQKQKEIINLLDTYPHLNLILIGDSGEHDPDIYMEIAEAFPQRILAIYLRSVKHKRKMLRVRSLYKDYNTVPVLLVDHSRYAVDHARAQGFIAPL